MSEGIEFKELEKYRRENKMTFAELAQKLKVPENYIYRWRKSGFIKGIYARLIKEVVQ